LSHEDPAIVANTVVCLIHQANYLLDHQIAALERAFVRDGGYSERLAAARIAERERTRHEQVPAGGVHRKPSDCPSCGKPLVLRTARKGKRQGARFWGCAGYPACNGTRPVAEPNDPTDRSDPTDPRDRCDRMREKPCVSTRVIPKSRTSVTRSRRSNALAELTGTLATPSADRRTSSRSPPNW
jgi:four helix bundle suffix protein